MAGTIPLDEWFTNRDTFVERLQAAKPFPGQRHLTTGLRRLTRQGGSYYDGGVHVFLSDDQYIAAITVDNADKAAKTRAVVEGQGSPLVDSVSVNPYRDREKVFKKHVVTIKLVRQASS
jgi:hypothetical protein